MVYVGEGVGMRSKLGDDRWICCTPLLTDGAPTLLMVRVLVPTCYQLDI